VTSPEFESFLARLYVDSTMRKAFLAHPEQVAREAGLDAASCAALARIDRQGLELAAKSYAQKRAHANRRRKWWWWPFRDSA